RTARHRVYMTPRKRPRAHWIQRLPGAQVRPATATRAATAQPRRNDTRSGSAARSESEPADSNRAPPALQQKVRAKAINVMGRKVFPASTPRRAAGSRSLVHEVPLPGENHGRARPI